MGLGKSLSIISLLAAGWEGRGETVRDARQPTLLIVPSPLLESWESELSQHLHPMTLSWCRYYGPKRQMGFPSILKKDIIITTYGTVASEWQDMSHTFKPLFSTEWGRIVLDEGKLILIWAKVHLTDTLSSPNPLKHKYQGKSCLCFALGDTLGGDRNSYSKPVGRHCQPSHIPKSV